MNASKENILFLNRVKKYLSENKVVSARQEAEILITGLSRMDRLRFFTGEEHLTKKNKSLIAKALKRRIKGVPLQHILKETNFFGCDFHVTKDVLIPRPETEILVEEALKILDQFYPKAPGKGPEVLDAGTGSGCIAVCLTLNRPDCRMTAFDVSAKALKVARKNIRHHGLSKKIKLIQKDLFHFFEAPKNKSFDVIVSNPPYVPEKEIPLLSKEVRSEPFLALNGGRKGLEVIQFILEKAPSVLKKGGWLLMEIGKGQSKALAKMMENNRQFQNFRFVKDFAGIDRILIARKA